MTEDDTSSSEEHTEGDEAPKATGKDKNRKRALSRREKPGRKEEPKRVIPAEVDGGGFYYFLDDLEEVQAPSPTKPGKYRPIQGAVRRHMDGTPHGANCKCAPPHVGHRKIWRPAKDNEPGGYTTT